MEGYEELGWPEEVGSPTQRAGKGWEVLQEGWEAGEGWEQSGGPHGEMGRVRRSFRRAGRSQESLPVC